jgi:hypothetical protein
MLQQVSSGDCDLDEQQAYLGNMISRLPEIITDLCATVPPDYRPAVHHGPVNDQPPLGTVFWFLWVLEVVGTMNTAPLELKAWVIDCFDRIFRKTGVLKAKAVADRLRIGEKGPILP